MAVSSDKSVICPMLIGRAPQLETVNRLLKQVEQGAGQVLLIAGEAGLGKSRLVAETRQHVVRHGWLILQGYCFETERSLPYAPIIDLLQTFGAGRSTEEMIQILGPGSPDLLTLLPEFAPRLPQHTAPEPDKHRLFYVLFQGLVGLTQHNFPNIPRVSASQPDSEELKGSVITAAGTPVLLIVEDLHWCDEASLELLLYLARHITTLPVLLLFTYRRDEADPNLTHFLAQLDRTRLATELYLPPLSREQIDLMLQAIFNQPRSTKFEFLDILHTLTEGNPFFIEEILKSMVMAGDIFFADDGIWDRKPLQELHIPRSVQDTVQQRSQQLSHKAQGVLTLAAVVGRRFDFTLLQQLTGYDEDELLAQFKELLAAQFIVEESADRFAFRHALTREAIYAALLNRERRQLHRTIGQILENSCRNASVPYVTDLADHFYRGEVWDKALDYSRRAGDSALISYAPQAAIIYYTHAIEASSHLAHPVSPQLYSSRGQAYAALNQFEAGQVDYRMALDAAHAQPERRLEWQTLLAIGNLWATRDYARAGDYFHQAHELARALDDPALIARSLNTIANWHMNQDRPFAALRDHQEALAIFQTASDTAGIAQTLDLLAITSYNCGDLLAGRSYYQQVLPLWQQLNDRRGMLHTLGGMALACDFELEFDDESVANCVAWAEQAVQISREIAWRSGEAFSLICLGLAQRQIGQYGLALEVLHRALVLAEDIEHHGWATDALRALGAVYLDILALPEARHYLERGLALAHEINSLLWVRHAAGTLAQVCIQQHELDQARQLLGETLTVDTPMQALQPRLLWGAQIELTLAEDESETALRLVERLTAATTNLSANDRRVTPRLWQLRGEALSALGRFAEAETVLRAAMTMAVAHGRRGRQWRLHLALAKVYLAQARSEQVEDELAAARALIHDLADTLAIESLPQCAALRDNFLHQALAQLPVVPSPTPRQQVKQQFGGLTTREREVATLVAQGKSNRAIAEELILSERTAERHIANIMTKLDFNSRAQIAAWVIEKGLTA